MVESAARLLRLLSLFQARREWPGRDLAERLDVDVRTVRRDVERLRGLGYPVHATPGVAGGYRLGAGAALPPLLLDDDEAVAVAVGLRTAASGTVVGLEETSLRALAKLEQVLPARLRHRVNAFDGVTVPLTGGVVAVDPEVLTVIAAACRDRLRLRFGYESHEGVATERLVEPLRLAFTGRRWYLLAYDVDREDWRTFRVDRIAAPPVPGFRFAPRDPPDEDLAAYMARSISSAPYKFAVRVVVHAPAEVVAERIGPAIGSVEALDEHTCVVLSGTNSVEGTPFYLAGLGFDFDVTEPPELVERLRTLAARFTKAIGGC